MTWADKLRQLSGFGGEPHRSEMAAILPMLSGAVRCLQRVADLAPTPILHQEVLPVIARADAVVHRVRDVLRDFGPVGSPDPRLGREPDGQNHWARLLHALEQHREVRQRLRELSISVEDTNPALSNALAEIGRDEDLVLEHLRDLIARADPQALN